MLFPARFKILRVLFALLVIISAVLRTVLLISVWRDAAPSVALVLEEYAVGFFFDCITFSYAAIPFVLYLLFIPERFFASPVNRFAVYASTFLIIYLLLFDFVAEYFFFQEFGTRFNFIAVDYLVYTREVIGNIRESYKLNQILVALGLLSAVIFLVIKRPIDRALQGHGTTQRRLWHGLGYLTVPVLAFALVSQSLTGISANQYADEIAGNGIYDLFAAFRNNELDYDRFYPTRDEGLVMHRLRQLVADPRARFMSAEDGSMARRIVSAGKEKRLNVILVVEESLSAEYLGTFGNRLGLTPNLDKLSSQSLLFTRLFATGTRTVRGLEAITLSMPPLPGISIVKRPDNNGFFSWGTVMRERGYDTKYIYAGYGYFDNMNAFFSGNGFDIVDRSDFAPEEISFANIWGVCDEDLFRKVVQEATHSYQRRKPFFSIVMTTSNHRPYTYPEGKVDIPSKSGRGGGVKYADYALGRLIAEAQKQPWFDDTIFVIVADHCAASAGSTEVPVKHYEIPLLIYAPAQVRPGRVETIGSQIDIAPTVLGLLNMSYESRFLGRDLLDRQNHNAPRAFLSTYQKLALLEEDRLVVISPQKQVRAYAYNWRDGSETPVAGAEEAVADALAYYQGANYLYTHRLNRVN